MTRFKLRKMRSSVGMLCLALLGYSNAIADVTLPDCFSDHMVLQQGMPVHIYGSAEPGECVRVRFQGQSKSCKADSQGSWSVLLDPLAMLPSKNSETMVVEGNNRLQLTDILVGEVWLGSGQSNMGLPTAAPDFREDVRMSKRVIDGPYSNIRILCSGGTWKLSSPNELEAFSALMFSFGYALQTELNVPVGLIVGAVGGTPSGRWVTAGMINEYLPELELAGKKVDNGKFEIGDLYHKHIAPFAGYTIRGVLWDQGESGVRISELSQVEAMGALIHGWRKAWQSPELPFLYMQKGSGMGCALNPENLDNQFARLFEPLDASAQVMINGRSIEAYIRIREFENTYLIQTQDLGAGTHPVNKTAYGTRAANTALARVYGRPVPDIGPTYAGHEIKDGKVVIHFKNTGGGLVVGHSDLLQGFVVRPKQGRPEWAQATISGDTIVVSSDKVPNPAVVYYAWHPVSNWANLFGKNGLPAVPFHTELNPVE